MAVYIDSLVSVFRISDTCSMFKTRTTTINHHFVEKSELRLLSLRVLVVFRLYDCRDKASVLCANKIEKNNDNKDNNSRC